MIYIENTNDVQTIKVYSAVERGSYTEPINPNPEGGGLTENEVEEIIDTKLDNYYDKQEIDDKLEDISTGGGGDVPSSDGKIFLARTDGHMYCDYVKEIVERCVTGKLSVVEFDETDDIQGTATILNFSKIFRPDFDMTGEEGFWYYLTLLYQNKEQNETKTFSYQLLEINGRYESEGMWNGFYDSSKIGYICSPVVKPFGGDDGRVLKINSNYSILVDDLNYAIDSIINGKNVVFELPDGSKTSFYYEVVKYDNYNEFGDWVSLTRKITIVDTIGLNSLDYAQYYHYEYFLYDDGTISNSSQDEIGNIVINPIYNGRLVNIEEGGTTDYYPVFHDVRITDGLYLHDTATLENYGPFEQFGGAIFDAPVEINSDVTINGRATFNNEPTFSATGSENYEDISSGILCDFKCQKAQVTNLYNRNIYMGKGENAINFIGNDNEPLAKIDNIGNIYEGETRLDDKYVLKTKYVALENKVLTLESTIDQIKQQLGIE